MHRMKKPKGRRAGPIDSTVWHLSVEYLQGLTGLSTLEAIEEMVHDPLHGGLAMQALHGFLNLRQADCRSTKGMHDLRSD